MGGATTARRGRRGLARKGAEWTVEGGKARQDWNGTARQERRGEERCGLGWAGLGATRHGRRGQAWIGAAGHGSARQRTAGRDVRGTDGLGLARQEWIASVGKRTERRRSVWLGRSGVECGREEGTGKAWQARQWLVTRRLARTRKERQGRKAGIGWVWKGAAGTASPGRAWLGPEGRGRQFNRR